MTPFAETKSILVAEDNAVNQLVIQGLLQALGLEAEIAADGSEAVRRFAQNPEKWAAILMDVHMPVMDGHEATQLIRAQGNTVPIIALTARALTEDRNRCTEAGMDHFLCKPVKLQQLKEVLVQAIGPD